MYRSWFTPLARVATPLALVALAACGSDSSTGTTGGGNSLTTTQRSTLNQTLARTDVMNAIASGGGAGAFVSYGLVDGGSLGLNSVGTISFTTPSANRLVPSHLVPAGNIVVSPSATTITGPQGTYKAFGAQLVLTDSSTEGVEHFVWTGILAIDNLDTPGVIVTAGVVSNDAASASSVTSTTFGDNSSTTRFASAEYIKLTGTNTSTAYLATSGTIAITSASFSGSTACPSANLPVFITHCTYSSGTIAGTFGFTATQIDGTDTVVIPSTTVNVPASQASIYFDQTAVQTNQ